MSDGELLTLWPGGRRRLMKDPDFGPIVRAAGPIRYPAASIPPFEYLSRAIIYQQLAGKAAQTIHGRFVAALNDEVTPAKVLRVRETTLRGAGLSRAKLAAVRDLASKVRSGEVVLDDLHERDDDEVVSRLTLVRGIGPWTAQMYLMFNLHRPDVWPVGDLGVRSGLARVLGMEDAPTEKEMYPLGERFRPWRSVTAWYCWRALENGMPGD